jgi:hypothetical protein
MRTSAKALIFLVAGSLSAAASATLGISTAEDGQRFHFKVYLNERPIGEHRFSVAGTGDTVSVTSTADFSVDFLFLNLYRYRHDSRETWRDGCLRAIDATTEDNGDRLVVRGEARGGLFSVTGPVGRIQAQGCLKSFAYWDKSFLEQPRLLNPQTGELVEVAATALGEERIEVRGQWIPASRYQLTADGVQIELWYNDALGWVALASDLGEGRRLAYRLQ